MRMSCSGCRVLRKGCSENCSIRPSLQWIKNPESQANATVFLAKFYGRAGLMNLINAGPEHVRPAIFRSLLYEACGRIVNPIYGSVGLLCSGSWQICQAAVDSVLKGAPIVPISFEDAVSMPPPPYKAYDIRHVSRDSRSGDLYKVGKCRTQFKRSRKTRVGSMPPPSPSPAPASPASPESTGRHWCEISPEIQLHRDRSPENESMYSMETAEESHVSQGEPNLHFDGGEAGLELTLSLDPPRCRRLLAGDIGGENTFPAVNDAGVDLRL